MDIESIREYCLAFEAASESLPFDDTTLVFKVGSKIFALLALEQPFSISLKCRPESATSLREEHSFITPGYHLNKRHWITVNNVEHIPGQLLRQLVDESYILVVNGMTRKERGTLKLTSDSRDNLT